MAATTHGPTIESLLALLDKGIEQRIFPAAQAAVICDGRVKHTTAHGVDHLDTPTTLETLFDVASVTKAAATTIATAILIARGAVALEDHISRYLPMFTGGGKESTTLRELLAHSSGLPPWEPMFIALRDDPEASSIFPGLGNSTRSFDRARELMIDATLSTPLSGARGQRAYSDLGFIVLGLVIESVAATSLEGFCRDEIFAPMSLLRTGFIDLRSRRQVSLTPEIRHVVPTGRTRPREPAPGQETLYAVHDQDLRADPGEVDDDNAYAMGGVAGHAGLFSTAMDLATLGWLINEELAGADRLGAGVAEVLDLFSRPDLSTRGTERGLGFDRPAQEDSLVGDRVGRSGPRGAIGHFGFTGCSFWMDLDRGVSIALTTNRTFHATLGRANVERVRGFRRSFHETIVDALS